MLILFTRWRVPRRIATGEIKGEVGFCRESTTRAGRVWLMSGVDVAIFMGGVGEGELVGGENVFVVRGELALPTGGGIKVVGGWS
jgi:hypothetical protein